MNPPIGWNTMESAPEDGAVVKLFGHYHGHNGLGEIRGAYEEGYTHGWADLNGNWFCAIGWLPLKEGEEVMGSNSVTTDVKPIITVDVSSNLSHRGKSLIVKLLMIILDQANFKKVQVNSDTLVAKLIEQCQDDKDMKEHLASVLNWDPTIIINEQFELASVESRYRDLLDRLGVQGHDGAITEINNLRKTAGLDSDVPQVKEDDTTLLEAIPRPTYTRGIAVLPPIYALNEAFKDLVQTIKEYDSIGIAQPNTLVTLRERISRENEINTSTIDAMESMRNITEILKHFINEADVKKGPEAE